jgi:carbon storage regulator
MLILERKLNESITIGGNIKVMVTKIKGGRVKILIDAPHDVRIMRTEIIEKLKQSFEKNKEGSD